MAVPAMRRPIRVAIVDDNVLMASALTVALSREPGFHVVVTVATVAGIDAWRAGRIDVVLTAFRLPDGAALDVASVVKKRDPGAKVLVLGAAATEVAILESIAAGADGYLSRANSYRELVDATRTVAAGEPLLTRAMVVEMTRRVADAGRLAASSPGYAAPDPGRRPPNSNLGILTRRERDVLVALSLGLSTPAICERLGISSNTLRTHTFRLFAKLHVHNRLQAVTVAMSNGLIDAPNRI